MGLVNRTVKPSEAESINTEGASTDQERLFEMQNHIQEYHATGADDSGYYDDSSGELLSYQEYKIQFYLDGANKKNSYMNHIPQIPSSDVPYKILGSSDYLIIRAEIYSTDSNSGKLFSIQDKANGYSEIFGIDVGSTSVDEYIIDNLSYPISNGMQIVCRVLNTRVDNPVVILTMRRIIESQ